MVAKQQLVLGIETNDKTVMFSWNEAEGSGFNDVDWICTGNVCIDRGLYEKHGVSYKSMLWSPVDCGIVGCKKAMQK